MTAQPNYPRQAGYYEGMLKGISFTLESMAGNQYLSHKEMVRLIQAMSVEIKEEIEKVNKECVY